MTNADHESRKGLTLDQALPLGGYTPALKSELGLALLHAGHGLLGGLLGFIFSHHFHACCHRGHHGACVGSGIEAHKVCPGGQG